MRTQNQDTYFFPSGKFLITALFLLGICATTRADITSATLTDGSGGAFDVSPSIYSGGSLSVSAWQYWGGQMLGTITTSDGTDPTLLMSDSINNDTAGSWVSYQVAVAMNTPFTFAPSSVSVNNPPNGDWSFSVVAPSLQVSGPFVGAYEGFLDFSAGTPVAVGQDLDFTYGMTFGGSSSYGFTQVMMPGVVPEPDQLTLVTISGLVFGGYRWLKRMCKA